MVINLIDSQRPEVVAIDWHRAPLPVLLYRLKAHSSLQIIPSLVVFGTLYRHRNIELGPDLCICRVQHW